jgi:hypothetical protein
MTSNDSKKPPSTVNAVTRNSLADIAGDLESAIVHLDAMIKVSREQLSNVSLNDSAKDILDRTGSTQSLLNAADKYLGEIKKGNHLLYEQAWALPVEAAQPSNA